MRKYEIIGIEYGYVHVRFSDNQTTVKIPDQAHIETWQPLTENWSKDRNGLYQFESKVHRKYYKHIDFDSFQVIDELDDRTIYFKDKNNVYVNSYMCGFSIVEEAIPSGFEIINIEEGFATDGLKDFYYAEKLPYRLKDRKPLNTLYSQVGDHIYFGMTEKMECDTQSFELVSAAVSNVAKDKSHVFYKNEIIEGANPLTFAFLEDCVSDKTPYYLNGDIDFYATDHKQAYFISTPFMVKVIKTKSLDEFRFQVIDEKGYAFDAQYRYERGKRKKLPPTRK